MKKLSLGLAAALIFTPAAWADNVAHCEILLLQTVAAENGAGEAQIATFTPAVTFLASLYDDEDGHIKTVNHLPIQAVLCRRNVIIPAPSDYNILATGIPFVLSQDFDSSETDSLTVYWKDGAFDYVYKGRPLTDEEQGLLDTRLAEFSARGLIKNPEEDTSDEGTSEEDLAEENLVEEVLVEEVLVETGAVQDSDLDESASKIETELNTEIQPENENDE